jgi:hypothetical protein
MYFDVTYVCCSPLEKQIVERTALLTWGLCNNNPGIFFKKNSQNSGIIVIAKKKNYFTGKFSVSICSYLLLNLHRLGW